MIVLVVSDFPCNVLGQPEDSGKVGTYIRRRFEAVRERERERERVIMIREKWRYITFVIHPPLMMAQSRAESTLEMNNYGKYIN